MPKKDEGKQTLLGCAMRYYWPKIYLMEDNDAKAVSSIDHEDETTQDPFHIAEQQ
jgi:hypothetical protein